MAALGQMSAGMVHELNQPLGALRTLSDNARVLLDQDRLPDVHGNLQRIALLVDRLGRLTFQLKAFAHKTQTPCVPVSVQQVITNAQFFISQRLREHSVTLHVQVVPSDLTTLAEESRLEQVIVNLMNNAIDAMSNLPIRHLWVSAESVDGLCCIKIIDSGLGIRADIMPRLFEPFNTSKPAGSGLGLGLMISAHIVREFGGIMKANNRETGGAQFTIDLPLAKTNKGS
jgi:two-component system C4-dicarboxylate transport sensor histidine kinase DctB